MSDRGIVTKIISKKLARVVVLPEERPHSDKDCVNCGGCGKTNEKVETIALNPIGAKVGDIVFLESDEGKSIWLMAVMMMGPILIPLAFFMGATWLGLAPIIRGILAGLGMYTAYRIIKYYNNKMAHEDPITRIVRILEKSNLAQIAEVASDKPYLER